MNLKSYYQKIDHRMLERFPNLWVLGIHIYLPILATLYFILFAVGFIYPLNPLPYFYDYESFFENLSLTMVLPTILLLVVFVIRQVKFNSKRVHLSLPYKHSFLVFLYFLVIIFSITVLPFIGNIAAYLKTDLTLNQQQYAQDAKVMSKGFCHFYLAKEYIDDPEHCAEAEAQGYYIDDYGDRTRYVRYELNTSRDSLIVTREFVDYSYSGGRDTISLDQAYKEIQDFIDLSATYEGNVKRSSPTEIVAINLKSDRFYNRLDETHRPAFDHLQNYERFDNNVNFHEQLKDKRSFFFATEFEFWQWYIFLALAISVLLIILCSVNISEFGWGMLVIALHPTVFGIVAALTAFVFRDFDGDTALYAGMVLLLLFTLNALFFAFYKRFKPALRRAFAITSHIYLPIVAVILLLMIKEVSHCCFSNNEWSENCSCFLPVTRDQFELISIGVVFFGSILMTYLFGRYYKRQYVNPQIK
ncbi:MAG: uncharacterized membrane protein (DUF485 family) [Bacteroidia bacterium]|jgi:uncharacterized membrane protein (DUF485 family)